jgi:hypothetical protein
MDYTQRSQQGQDSNKEGDTAPARQDNNPIISYPAFLHPTKEITVRKTAMCVLVSSPHHLLLQKFEDERVYPPDR